VYNFRKDAKVYIYMGDILYPIDIYPDLTFSQTFNENSHAKKTLHNQLALNHGATIVEANVANFSFTMPIKLVTDIEPILSILESDYSTGTIESSTMYASFTDVIFKLNNAVVETLTYNIDRASTLTVSVSGTFSLLEPVASLPATPEPVNPALCTIVKGIEVILNGATLPSIAAINLEISNSIEWTNNSTLHKSLANQLSYKDSYVLQERRVTGSITEFLLDTSGVDYSTTSSLVIKLYSEIGQDPPFMTFNLPEVVYTRRTNIDELLTRVYDFRLTSNNVLILPELRS
jgi:hypothetical protein